MFKQLNASLYLWALLIALFVTGVVSQTRCYADSVTSQSALYTGGFFIDAPFVYNWRGTVRVDYLLSGNAITIQKVDQSVDISSAASFDNPLGMVANISVDVLNNGSQKIATIYPTSAGSYLHGSADLVFGGINYPNLKAVNPTFKVTMVVLAAGGFGWYSRSWTFRPDITAATPFPVPLYRYANDRSGDHFYTVRNNDLRSIGYHQEGIQCHVFLVPVAGRDTPLYRYYNSGIQKHFYTTGNYNLTNIGYHMEGIEGYVNGFKGCSADPNLVPLYRYYNPRTSAHFYTTNFGELGSGNREWQSEGIECNVLP